MSASGSDGGKPGSGGTKKGRGKAPAARDDDAIMAAGAAGAADAADAPPSAEAPSSAVAPSSRPATPPPPAAQASHFRFVSPGVPDAPQEPDPSA